LLEQPLNKINTGIGVTPVSERYQYQNDPSGSQTLKFASQSFSKSEVEQADLSKSGQDLIDTGISVIPVSQEYGYLSDTGISVTPVSDRDESHRDTSVGRSTVLTDTSIPKIPASRRHRHQPDTGINKRPETGFFPVPNEIADRLLPLLSAEEFKVYFRLYRLSHGFHRNTCFVGYSALARSTSLGIATVKRVVPRLASMGLVRVVNSINTRDVKGTTYEVDTVINETPVSARYRSQPDTSISVSPNKHDDHDHDLKKTDHRQSAPPVENSGGRADGTMTIISDLYRELTGNSWTEFDERQFQEISHLDPEKTTEAMRAIHSRAGQPIGTFAYFVKGIRAELSPQGRQSKALLKQRYEKLARELAANRVGANDAKPSDLVDTFKNRCLQDGLHWNDDLANEVLGL